MADRKTKAEVDLDINKVVDKVEPFKGAIHEMDKSVTDLDKDMGGLDRKVSETGTTMVKTAAETSLLNAELKKARDRLAELRTEFATTGDYSLLKQIRQARSEVTQIEKIAKDMGGSNNGGGKSLLSRLFGAFTSSGVEEDATKEGFSLGKLFGNGIAQGIGEAFDVAWPVLVPLVAFLVVDLLAAVNAALVAGIGLLGIGVGIAGAFQDPRVKAAVSSLGGDIKTTFKDATSSFIDPMRGALNELDQFVQGLHLGAVFAPLAAVVGNLERGIEGFVSAALPGFADGFKRAAPLVAFLAEQMPKIGKAFGDFVEKVTSSEAGNRAALVAIVDVIDNIIEGLGSLLEQGSHVFAGLVRVFKPVLDILDDIVTYISKLPVVGLAVAELRPGLHAMRKDTDDMSAALNKGSDAIDESSAAAQDFSGNLKSTAEIEQLTADNAKKLNDAFDQLFGRFMSLDEANLKFNEGLVAIKQSLDQNGNSLDITKEKGQANIKVIEKQITNIKDLRDAQIANGDALDDANKKYDDNLTALRNQLIQMGFNKKVVDELIDKYKGIPGSVTTTVSVLGLDAATYQVESVTKQLNALDDRIVTTYVVLNTVTGTTSTITKSGPKYKASGGPVYAGQDYVIGENGPEFFRPSVNGYIFPNSSYNSQMAQNGGRATGTGGGTFRHELVFTGAAAGSLGSVIMGMVRTGEIQIKMSQLVSG